MENKQSKGGVFLSPNPKKESIVIDANGNILSSKNPREAQIIGKVDLSEPTPIPTKK